jgi:hypothetical protein
MLSPNGVRSHRAVPNPVTPVLFPKLRQLVVVLQSTPRTHQKEHTRASSKNSLLHPKTLTTSCMKTHHG